MPTPEKPDAVPYANTGALHRSSSKSHGNITVPKTGGANPSETREKETHESIMSSLLDQDWKLSDKARHALGIDQEPIICLPQTPSPPYSPLPSSDASVLGAVDQDSFLIRNGIPYMPLPDAVRHTGVNRDTLLNWVKNKVEFNGEPIDAVYFKLTGNHFISKLSVERIANRFIKWPSEEPVSNVALGETEQKTGYLSTTDAARQIGMQDVTLRKWIREQNAPPALKDLLDVVKDTASGYFHIHQQSVEKIAAHVKVHGVTRGRRVQPS